MGLIFNTFLNTSLEKYFTCKLCYLHTLTEEYILYAARDDSCRLSVDKPDSRAPKLQSHGNNLRLKHLKQHNTSITLPAVLAEIHDQQLRKLVGIEAGEGSSSPIQHKRKQHLSVNTVRVSPAPAKLLQEHAVPGHCHAVRTSDGDSDAQCCLAVPRPISSQRPQHWRGKKKDPPPFFFFF